MLLNKSRSFFFIFLFLGRGLALRAVVVVRKIRGGMQECQFNLKCLSLVFQLLRFKRPGQLELPDFCHFDLFCFSAVMYTLIPAHLPSVCAAAAAAAEAAGGEV